MIWSSVWIKSLPDWMFPSVNNMKEKEMLQKKRADVRTFACSVLRAGCIGFGGGNALIPVMKHEFVDRQKFLTRQEYEQDIFVANLTPGALPVELAAAAGRRKSGCRGMLLGAVLFALPGAVMTVLMLYLLGTLHEEILGMVHKIAAVASLYIGYLLFRYIRDVFRQCKKRGRAHTIRAAAVMCVSFFLVSGKNWYRLFGKQGEPFLCVPTILVLVSGLLFLVVREIVRGIKNFGKERNRQEKTNRQQKKSLYEKQKKQEEKNFSGWEKQNHAVLDARKSSIVFGIFLTVAVIPSLFYGKMAWIFAGKSILSVFVSYGGGDAYLTVAQGIFSDSGLLSESAFYGQIVPVINLLPGSILTKALTGIGYMIGIQTGGSLIAGLCFACAGFAVSVAVSGCSFFVVDGMRAYLGDTSVMTGMGHMMGPMVAGLLLNLLLSLLNQNIMLLF